jgi:hypothetical protein
MGTSRKLYLVQEYCDGGTVRLLVDEGHLKTGTAWGVEVQEVRSGGNMFAVAHGIAANCGVCTSIFGRTHGTSVNVLLKVRALKGRSRCTFCAAAGYVREPMAT